FDICLQCSPGARHERSLRVPEPTEVRSPSSRDAARALTVDRLAWASLPARTMTQRKAMIMFHRTKLFVFATTAIASGTIVLSNIASADLFSECEVRPGSTRFYDFESDHCGYVFGNNAVWGNLPGGWNDRADQFGNDGRTSSNCLYQDVFCSGS